MDAVVGLGFVGFAAEVVLWAFVGFFGWKPDGRGRLLDWVGVAEAVEGGVGSLSPSIVVPA